MSGLGIRIAGGMALLLALLAALCLGERHIEARGYARARAEDNAAIEQGKREAANALLRITERVHDAERALQAATDLQNRKDSDYEKDLLELSGRLHAAAGPGGRLRDPNAPAAFGCGPGGAGPSGEAASNAHPGAADAAQTGGVFSAAATELLERLTFEADTINAAYASCRMDALAVRQKITLED
jgi:hypothetical protein